MRPGAEEQHLVFENVWGKDADALRDPVLAIWRRNGGPTGDDTSERLRQLVFVLKNADGEVVGMSTAFKAHIKRLRNYFYVIRLMLVPGYRIPGLTSRLLVSTRDFLESIHEQESTNRAIGIITLVENQRIREKRNEAIWPASGMVYIGNSGAGHPIRVYYFRGARIQP